VTDPNAEEIVNRFLATWDRGDVEDWLGFFAEDAVWHNMPMEPAVGIDAIRKMLVEFGGAMEGLHAEVHVQLSDGQYVMHERTDHFSLGGQVVALPICGVFEIVNGRIKSWRDYFDMSRLTG
jgi:limonene-1,2-epoxide hydrolase